MKISEIQEMILNDSKINMSAIDEESNRAIALHAKYLGLYQNERQIHFLLDENYRKLKLRKMEYYLGRADDEIYQSHPLNLKIPRQDLDFYLDADDELCELKRRVTIAQNKMDLLKSFIDHNLNQRSYHFKNVLSFLNWSLGK